MRRGIRGVVPWLIAASLPLGACSASHRDRRPRSVVLISVDGMRWDYPDSAVTPNLDFMAENGVKAEALIPSFPTKTFPDHYSIATGLYPEHNGIIANNMWDTTLGRTFSLSDRDAVQDPAWWGGEPIWVTAEKQGRVAAAFFWPGTATLIEGVRPTFWQEYDGSIPNERRVEQVLAWLALPEGERPSLITLYFSDVDDAGHRYGPLSPRTWEVVSRIDSILGILIDGVRDSDGNLIDIILVSDHGMTGISPDRMVFLDDYIDLKDVTVSDWAPVTALWPKAGAGDAVYERLKGVKHIEVYRKQEIPEEYHYRASPRIAPIIVVGERGWSISRRSSFKPERFEGGTHGYANSVADMNTVFVAWGPDFKRGLTVQPFQSIHIYDLIAEILGLDPALNDGSLDSVRVMLR